MVWGVNGGLWVRWRWWVLRERVVIGSMDGVIGYVWVGKEITFVNTLCGLQ